MFKGPYTDLPFRLFEDETTNLLWNRINSGGAKVKYWNQVVDFYNAGTAINGVKITYNPADNSYTANGTATANIVFIVNDLIYGVDGHKYLICGCPAGGDPNSKYNIYYYASNNAVADAGNGAISTNVYKRHYLYIRIYNGITCDNLVFKPRMIDLTDIFGYGKEPTTATDPRLDAVKAYAAKHGEYKPSSWLIDGIQWTYGANINDTTGVPATYIDKCALSDFIDVSGCSNIEFLKYDNLYTYKLACYDENKNFISQQSWRLIIKPKCDIPFDTAYIRLVFMTGPVTSDAPAMKPKFLKEVVYSLNYADIPYYNQWLKFTYPKTTSSGVLCEPLGNGKYSIKGTATANVWFNLNSSTTITEKDHKYLITGNPIKGTSQSAYDICLYVDKVKSTRLDIGDGAIVEGTGNGSPFYVKVSNGATVDCIVEPRLIDITDIYGYGNEPVGGYEATDDRVKELRRYAKAHWEYNEGSWVYDGVHWGNGIWRDGTTGEVSPLAGGAASSVLSTEGLWRIARRINKNVIYNTAVIFYDADKAIISKYNSSTDYTEWSVPTDAAYYRLFINRVNFDLPINPDYLDEVKFVALSEDFAYYNQLYNSLWAATLPYNHNGCTWSLNEDGSIHVEGTLAIVNYTSCYIRAANKPKNDFILNHKYLVYNGTSLQNATFTNIVSDNYRIYTITDITANGPCFYYARTAAVGDVINYDFPAPFIVDLTNLFGYGQEPISYADTRIKMLAKYLEIRGNDYVANPGATPDGVGLTRMGWLKHIVGQPVEIAATANKTYACRNLLYDISEYAGGDMRRSTDPSAAAFGYYYAFADKDKKFIENGYGYVGKGGHVAIPYNACYVMHALTSIALAPNITDDVLTFTKADVKWNQIFDYNNSNFTGRSDVSITKANDEYTITATAPSSNYTSNFVPIDFIVGHTYIFTGAASKDNINFWARANDTDYARITNGEAIMFTVSSELKQPRFYITVSQSTATTSLTFRPKIVDITYMFGSEAPTVISDAKAQYAVNYAAKHPEYAPIGIAPASISSLTRALFPKETEADDWANGDTILNTSTGATDTLAFKSSYNSSRWEMTSTTSEFFKSGNRYTKA